MLTYANNLPDFTVIPPGLEQDVSRIGLSGALRELSHRGLRSLVQPEDQPSDRDPPVEAWISSLGTMRMKARISQGAASLPCSASSRLA
jgi:hypothetical protein